MKMRNCLTQPTYTTATQKENRAKNRNPNALPGRQERVHLMQGPAFVLELIQHVGIIPIFLFVFSDS